MKSWSTRTFLVFLLAQILVINNSVAVLPGMKMIASKAGLDYVASKAVQVIFKKATGRALPDQSGTADVTIGKVSYSLTGMKVTDFTSPTSSLTIQPSQGVTWSLHDAGVSVNGDWKYEYKKGIIHVRDHGSFVVSARGIGITISVTLSVSAGEPSVTLKATGCSSKVNDVSVKFVGAPGWLYSLFKHQVAKRLRRNLGNTMCTVATKSVDVDLAKQVADIKWVVYEEKLEFDYFMVTSPEFQSTFLATFHKGEVFWTGNRTEAPFQPTPFPDVGQPQMLTLQVSDYVLTTLAYVMQQHGEIQNNLTKDELPKKDRDILNTTCSSTCVCLGSLLPQVGKLYPSLSMELDMATTHAPVLNILPRGIHGNFTGFTNYYVRLNNGSRAFLFATDLDKVLDLVFKTVADCIVPKLSELGRRGLALPSMKNVKYVNPTLKLFQGSLMLSTDLQYDPSKTTLYYQPKTSVRSQKDVKYYEYKEYERLVQMVKLSNDRRLKK